MKQFPEGIELPLKWAEWIDYRRKLDINVRTFVGASQKDLAGFLFTNIGPELEDIIVTRDLFQNPSDKPNDFPHYDNLVESIGEYFRKASDPAANMTKFNLMKQGSDETAHDFCTKLLKQAEVCNLKNNYDAVRNRFIDGMLNRALAERAYEDGRPLEEIVAIASRKEIEKQKSVVPSIFGQFAEQSRGVEVAALSGQRPSGSFVARGKFDRRENNRQPGYKSRPSVEGRKPCYKCGLFSHKNGYCRAERESCRKCGKQGHFEKVCRSSTSIAAIDENIKLEDAKVVLYQ